MGTSASDNAKSALQGNNPIIQRLFRAFIQGKLAEKQLCMEGTRAPGGPSWIQPHAAVPPEQRDGPGNLKIPYKFSHSAFLGL